jgi:hypothetical protein
MLAATEPGRRPTPMHSVNPKHRLRAVAIAIGAVLVSSDSAYAYLDPGTASLILQGIIGGIAAGLVVIKLYWQKLKQFIRLRRASNPPEGASARHVDKSAG